MKKCILLISIFLFFPIMVLADKKEDEVIISCDSEKININEQVVCRVSVNSSNLFDKINYTIDLTEGLEIVDVRSNYEDLWEVKNNYAISKELNTGLQEFGIILLKSSESGEKKVTLKDIVLENSNNKEKYELKEISSDIKVISDDNLLKNITIDGKELENFNSNTLSYNYYIDDKVDKITIGGAANNEFSKVNGIGEIELSLNNGKFVFPIEVISENGNAKVYLLNVIRDGFKGNGIIKELESLKITDNSNSVLLIDFKPDKYEYNINVGINTKFLNIKPSLQNDDLSFVKNYGERKVNLNYGDNVILIKIKDNEGEILTYTLNIIKPLVNKSDNNYIKSLYIKGYELGFNKRVKNYILSINKDDTKLNIKPVLDDEKASYEILGNSNLKEGSIIKIIVTASNQEKTTYQISIKIKDVNYLPYILWPLGILGLIGIGIGLYFKYKMVLKLKKLELENKKKAEVNKKTKNTTNGKKKTTTNDKTKKSTKNANLKKTNNSKRNSSKSAVKKSTSKNNVNTKKKTTTSKNVKQTKKNSTNKGKTTTKAVKKNAKKK